MHFVDGIKVKVSKRSIQINSSTLDIQIKQAKCALAVSNNLSYLKHKCTI